jgi:hypothetical protein
MRPYDWLRLSPYLRPMTPSTHTVVLSLWCAQPILLSAAVLILWRRKLHKQFPVFFLFLLAQVANFAALFPLWLVGSGDVYFYLFWLGEAVNALLGFKVIHEVFLDVFRPYHTLRDLGTLLFKWAGVVLLLVSVVVAFSNSSDGNPLMHALTTLQRSVRIVQVGLIFFLLLFARFLGVSRRQVSFGISCGFGFLAGVELMLMALHSGGFVTLAHLNLINMTSYLAAVGVWIGYALSRQAVRAPAINHLQTERWERGLADLQQPEFSGSLIPMFEGMVERAFSRSSNLESIESHIPLHSPTNPPEAKPAVAGSRT